MDWAKDQGVKFSYTIEMRPERTRNIYEINGGFFLDESKLIPAAEDVWEIVKVIAEAVIADSDLRHQQTTN